jgi:cardiolipin synthase
VKSQFWTAPNQITLLRLIFVPLVVMNVMDRRYKLALVLFVLAGISDAVDGLLARILRQQTIVGQYMDPIADKLLLSSTFLVLSFTKQIPWKFTVLVFSRDLSIVLVVGVLYIATNIRDFRPSIFGKLNTGCQVAAIFFVLLWRVSPQPWIATTRLVSLWATFGFTVLSGIHYIILTGQKLHTAGDNRSTSAPPR